MKILIALLSVLLLSSCAKPVPPVTAPSSQPACFAPAGFYMAFAGLQKHNCKQAPKETIVFGVEVKPNTLVCGFHKDASRNKEGAMVTSILAVSERGLVGRVLVETKECRALYDVVFLKMKDKASPQ